MIDVITTYGMSYNSANLYTGRLQDIPDLGQRISETGAGPRIFYVIKSFFVCV